MGTVICKFNKLPDILDILDLLQKRTEFTYRFGLNDYHVTKEKEMIVVDVFDITPIFLEVAYFYKKQYTELGKSYGVNFDMHIRKASKEIIFSLVGSYHLHYELQVLRKVCKDLGAISEIFHTSVNYEPVKILHEYKENGAEICTVYDEDENIINPNLWEGCHIPDYAMFPWYHEKVGIDCGECKHIRERTGWKRNRRPPFVTDDFIQKIELGMQKPRNKPI